MTGGEQHYLILETKGYDPLREVKEQAAKRWVQAASTESSIGAWSYVVITDLNKTKDEITHAARMA